VALLRLIRELLYNEGYTIKGVQKLMRDGALKQRLAQIESEVVAAAASAPPSIDALPAARVDDEALRGRLRALLTELEELRERLRAVLA
jgi:DNA-binding transcriptional MerR regulator